MLQKILHRIRMNDRGKYRQGCTYGHSRPGYKLRKTKKGNFIIKIHLKKSGINLHKKAIKGSNTKCTLFDFREACPAVQNLTP